MTTNIPNMPSIPLGITTKTLTPVMLINPGKSSLFHVLIEVALGQIENSGNAPLDMVFNIDISGSTGLRADDESHTTILEVEKEALIKVVQSITNPQAKIGIVAFDTHVGYDDAYPMTFCDLAGKIKLCQFIDNLSPRGGTQYESGLKAAINMFPPKDPSRKRVMIFTSDGENVSGVNTEAVRLAKTIIDDEIQVFIAGIGKKMEDDNKTLLSNMSGGNFRHTNNSDEILEFFSDAQQIALSSAVTNGILQIKVPKFVERIETFALGFRNGAMDYVAGEIDPNDSSVATVKFNTLADDEKLSFYLGLKVIQREGIEEGKAYSYGLLKILGQVASMGLNGELGQGNVKVYFAGQSTVDSLKQQAKTTGGSYINIDVDDVMKVIMAARDLHKATTTDNADEAEKLVEQARRTVAFLPKDKTFGLEQTVEVVASNLKSGDVHAAGAELRGATVAFSGKNKAKKLNTNKTTL